MPPTDAFGGHCQIYNCWEANHNEHQPASVNIYFALKQVYQFTDTVSNQIGQHSRKKCCLLVLLKDTAKILLTKHCCFSFSPLSFSWPSTFQRLCEWCTMGLQVTSSCSHPLKKKIELLLNKLTFTTLLNWNLTFKLRLAILNNI